MIKLFRSGSAFAIIPLLVYTLILKFHIIINPSAPALAPGAAYLYERLINMLQNAFGKETIIYGLLVIILLFWQAVMINNIVIKFRLLPKPTWLPAMSFILFTSFIKEWNIFSPALVANVIILWSFRKMILFYGRNAARDIIFNAGLLIGLASLIYLPAAAMIMLIWISLLIDRPFRLAEWLIALMGLLAPFYFLGAFLFLTDHWDQFLQIQFPGFQLPVIPHLYYYLAGIIVILLFFLGGLMVLQRQLLTMLIQTRKIWSILLAYAIIAAGLPLISEVFYINGWIIALPPLVVFAGNAWYAIKKRALANMLHLALIAFAIYMMYWTV